jgi:hypothetical protein
VRHGWYIAVAYVVGFALMVAVAGWQPTPNRSSSNNSPTTAVEQAHE